MIEPVISIIVPVYQAEATLKRCIDSLIRQTIQNIEIILVDDGCKDGSPALCDEYGKKDDRIRVYHIPNSGVSVARNMGLDVAKGQYAVMIDSDDWIDDDYCRKMLETQEYDKDAENVWCGMQVNIEVSFNKVEELNWNSNEDISICQKSDFLKLYEKWLTNSPCNKLFHRDIIEKYNIRYLKGFWPGQDLLFNLEYMNHTNHSSILVCNKAIYHYMRKSDGSLDTKYKKDLYGTYQFLIKAIDENRKKFKCISTDDDIAFGNICFNFFERVFHNTLRNENKASLRQKIKFNNDILQSELYKRSIKAVNFKNIHPLMVWAYKQNTYYFILIIESLIKVRNKLFRILKFGGFNEVCQ